MFQIVTSTCQLSSNIINSFVNNKRSALNIYKKIYLLHTTHLIVPMKIYIINTYVHEPIRRNDVFN